MSVWNPRTQRWESQHQTTTKGSTEGDAFRKALAEGDADGVRAYLLGLIDGRIRKAKLAEGESEAEGRRKGTKVRSEAAINEAVWHPTKRALRLHPEYRELIEASAKAKGAPVDYKPSFRKKEEYKA